MLAHLFKPPDVRIQEQTSGCLKCLWLQNVLWAFHQRNQSWINDQGTCPETLVKTGKSVPYLLVLMVCQPEGAFEELLTLIKPLQVPPREDHKSQCGRSQMFNYWSGGSPRAGWLSSYLYFGQQWWQSCFMRAFLHHLRASLSSPLPALRAVAEAEEEQLRYRTCTRCVTKSY